jgi:hypothetical protein
MDWRFVDDNSTISRGDAGGVVPEMFVMLEESAILDTPDRILDIACWLVKICGFSTRSGGRGCETARTAQRQFPA